MEFSRAWESKSVSPSEHSAPITGALCRAATQPCPDALEEKRKEKVTAATNAAKVDRSMLGRLSWNSLGNQRGRVAAMRLGPDSPPPEGGPMSSALHGRRQFTL